jgi:hypothetical protein
MPPCTSWPTSVSGSGLHCTAITAFERLPWHIAAAHPTLSERFELYATRCIQINAHSVTLNVLHVCRDCEARLIRKDDTHNLHCSGLAHKWSINGNRCDAACRRRHCTYGHERAWCGLVSRARKCAGHLHHAQPKYPTVATCSATNDGHAVHHAELPPLTEHCARTSRLPAMPSASQLTSTA